MSRNGVIVIYETRSIGRNPKADPERKRWQDGVRQIGEARSVEYDKWDGWKI